MRLFCVCVSEGELSENGGGGRTLVAILSVVLCLSHRFDSEWGLKYTCLSPLTYHRQADIEWWFSLTLRFSFLVFHACECNKDLRLRQNSGCSLKDREKNVTKSHYIWNIFVKITWLEPRKIKIVTLNILLILINSAWKLSVLQCNIIMLQLHSRCFLFVK